ncbi:hypothetical protein NDU88_006187 [Pleurodeles waltl]|uniref:Uncharacterized protein n=1 Tax=Pleurodeles waltl TaxID=8319 RepID=A0AAV7MDD5_PLEWA|nr:hypothetical protein NDU88_006187 [Pleurodeles waltl]
MDWGKDSSDKFYSLTEESDLGSADGSFSETDESETSETGNKSPSGEHTVRKVRQRKFVKSRSGLQQGLESTASMSGRTLRWDYSGIGLADTPTGGNQSPANDKNGSDLGAAAGSIGNPGNIHVMGTKAGILQSIYSSIKELQTETRIESRRARVATKRLQGSVIYTMSNMYKVYGIVVGPLGSSFFFLPRPRGEHGNKKINRYVYTMSNMYKVYGIVVGPLGSSFFFLPRPRGEHGNKKINRYVLPAGPQELNFFPKEPLKNKCVSWWPGATKRIFIPWPLV